MGSNSSKTLIGAQTALSTSNWAPDFGDRAEVYLIQYKHSDQMLGEVERWAIFMDLSRDVKQTVVEQTADGPIITQFYGAIFHATCRRVDGKACFKAVHVVNCDFSERVCKTFHLGCIRNVGKDPSPYHWFAGLCQAGKKSFFKLMQSQDPIVQESEVTPIGLKSQVQTFKNPSVASDSVVEGECYPNWSRQINCFTFAKQFANDLGLRNFPNEIAAVK